MKKAIFSIAFIAFTDLMAVACPLCDKQQPKLLRGITHGVGPQSNWDWVIVGAIVSMVLYSLFLSVKYLLRPQEENVDHIKNSILN